EPASAGAREGLARVSDALPPAEAGLDHLNGRTFPTAKAGGLLFSTGTPGLGPRPGARASVICLRRSQKMVSAVPPTTENRQPTTRLDTFLWGVPYGRNAHFP